MAIKIPNWAGESLQSLAVAIQQGKREDALGTLACVLAESDSERLQDLATKIRADVPIRQPAN